MKSAEACFNEFGGPDKLKLQDVPDPTISPTEVLVRVRACALNHLDLFVREGIPALKTPLPFWTGCDIAGDVVEVGAAVIGRQGRARAWPSIPTSPAAAASSAVPGRGQPLRALRDPRRARCPAAWPSSSRSAATACCALPDAISYEDAASFVLTNMTAWRMVVTQGQAARRARTCSSSAWAAACRRPRCRSPSSAAPASS